MEKMITVIIPVYNVELYIDKCIKSILDQTVTNYEIIIVDDGSTDRCGMICDEWEKKSDKIISLHKKNGGLSDARNYGVKYVKTQYVTFIDSDDYVEPQYIELLEKGLEVGADLIITDHIQEYENQPQKAKILSGYKLMTPKEALIQMCYENVPSSAWGKLFQTDLIKQVPFPVGKIYEDLFSVPEYIRLSKAVAYNESQTYHYLQRKGSIRKAIWNPRTYDVIEAAEKLLKNASNMEKEVYLAALFQFFYAANEYYTRAFLSTEYLKVINPVRKKIKSKFRDIVFSRKCRLKYKIQFGMMAFTPRTYKRIWKWKRHE